MNREEIKIFINNIENINYSSGMTRYLKYHHNNIYNDMIQLTNYLPEDCAFSERTFNIINDLYERPICEYCKKNPIAYQISNVKYGNFCSRKCSNVLNREKIKTSHYIRSVAEKLKLKTVVVKEKPKTKMIKITFKLTT